MTALLFVLAAGLGAAARHGVNQLGSGWVGTVVVNVVGAFSVGWLVANDPGATAVTVVGVGFLGSLTTFSTFALEATEGPVGRRLAVVTTTLALGVPAAALGFALG